MRTVQFKVGENVFSADVAENPITRARGLSGRDSMARDAAMLFIFPVPWRYSFWMKDMKFPLDMIWIRKGRVADITSGMPVPAPRQSLFTLPAFKPTTAVDAALEINAGLAGELSIRIGDKVEW